MKMSVTRVKRMRHKSPDEMIKLHHVIGLLDCRVHCSDRKTIFQSLKMMYDYKPNLVARTPRLARGSSQIIKTTNS